jgi:GNAT superfamily N-acetyltransferase
MMEPSKYSVVELLRDGRPIHIRALRASDRPSLLAAVDRMSAQSIYSRFFFPKRGFTEEEVSHFLDVDFVNEVALVAVMDHDGQQMIAGGARYVVVEAGVAEVAFAVVDQFQRLGICGALMPHIAAIARDAGVKKMIADVLSENFSMLRVFERSGLQRSTRREAGVVHVVLGLV